MNSIFPVNSGQVGDLRGEQLETRHPGKVLLAVRASSRPSRSDAGEAVQVSEGSDGANEKLKRCRFPWFLCLGVHGRAGARDLITEGRCGRIERGALSRHGFECDQQVREELPSGPAPLEFLLVEYNRSVVDEIPIIAGA